MSLNNLSNENLVSSFKDQVRSERKITALILEYIAEIDHRKLYLEKSFTSLFDYLVRDFGYSPGAAMRRIDAARLLREIPETAVKFQNGTLTLSQANQIQRAARDFKKTKHENLDTINKRELIGKIENTTQKQTEQILTTSLDLPVVPQQKETCHRDESVTLTITFTKEQIQVLEQAQNMISHSVVNKDWAETLTHLAKREVARRTNLRKTSISNSKSTTVSKQTNVVATLSSNRPAIPAHIRKNLLHAKAQCAHTDSNGNRCASQRFLQIDHIKSWSRGGSHEAQNLQVLCGVHNRLKYERD
ncbi:HNH endonuclease [bacterium]|nr:HNH endonuclease [bacterium]